MNYLYFILQSYFEELSSDTEVRSNIQKIIAHVETSARQCQVRIYRTLYLFIHTCTCTFLIYYPSTCTCSIHLYSLLFVYSLQSLRKRFSQYAFLWEQDVLATFDDFLKGVAQPHPQRFTRPETVTRSRSATHSARPKRYLYYMYIVQV